MRRKAKAQAGAAWLPASPDGYTPVPVVAQVFYCLRCGALVIATAKHDDWHAA